MSYDITWHTYTGPNPLDERNINYDCAIIRKGPAPCGEYSYPTIEAARAAIAAEWPEHREVTPDNGLDWPDRDILEGYPGDGEPVEVYKPGLYPRLSPATSVELEWRGIKADIKADTTDEQIDDLVDAYADEVLAEGYILDQDAIRKAMLERRDELRKGE